MNWLYSQALVEEFSAVSCSDGAPSAPLKLNPMPQAYLSSDRMTDFSRLSRFGMTFEPLTDDRGEELLTLFLADFPVKTLAPQEKAQESMVHDPGSGWKWQESSVKYDQRLRSWKTRQCSFLEGLDEFSETWPRWGTMRDGECWERTMSAHLMSGKEFTCLPTPTASMAKKGWGFSRNYGMKRYSKAKMKFALNLSNGLRPLPELQEVIMGWPPGWTALKPLATAKYPNAPQKHGKS